MLKQGLYNMTNREYHFGIGAFAESKSSLSNLLDSARKYRYEKDNPEHLDVFDLKSKKFNDGTAFHTFFLEPDKFKSTVSIIPEFSGKGSKTKRKEYKQKVLDKKLTPISSDVFTMLHDIDTLLHSGEHEEARKIIEDPKRLVETSGFWEDPNTGLWLKFRLDLLSGNSIIWDLKKHTSLISFRNQASYLHYDLQAFMTLMGISIITGVEHHKFGFIVFHAQEPPYDIEVVEADNDFLTSGQDKFYKCLGRLKDCAETDKWPGKYPDEVGLLSPPKWRLNQLMLEGKIHE
jgi:hypothetical protein